MENLTWPRHGPVGLRRERSARSFSLDWIDLVWQIQINLWTDLDLNKNAKNNQWIERSRWSVLVIQWFNVTIWQSIWLTMLPLNVQAKSEVRSFTGFWGNSDWSFEWVANPTNRGIEEAIGALGGRGWYIRKSVGEFLYRFFIVTFPISLCVSEILPLLCSSTPVFHTPLLVSPKLSHVPLGVVVDCGGLLYLRERRSKVFG